MKKRFQLFELMEVDKYGDGIYEMTVLRPMDSFDTLEEAEEKALWWVNYLNKPYPIAILTVYTKEVNR